MEGDVIKTQDIIMLLAKYIEQGLDLETASVLDRELEYHPKAILFLMKYGHTLSFYKRHQNNNGKISWIVEYLNERMPGSLSELVEGLVYRGPLSVPLSLVGKDDGSTSEIVAVYKYKGE